jgi:hypothetical protein
MLTVERTIVALTALLVVGVGHADAPAFVDKALFGGKVRISVPAEFRPMSPELLKQRYPSAYPPALVYMNESSTINIAVDHTTHSLKTEQLPAAIEQVRQTFRVQHPTARFLRSEMTQINGKPYFIIEVETPAANTTVHNIMVGTSLDDRLMVASFNCPKTDAPTWLETGRRVIQSIEVK